MRENLASPGASHDGAAFKRGVLGRGTYREQISAPDRVSTEETDPVPHSKSRQADFHVQTPHHDRVPRPTQVSQHSSRTDLTWTCLSSLRKEKLINQFFLRIT